MTELPSQSRDETLGTECIGHFRQITGIEHSDVHDGWTQTQLLAEPLERLGVDSLTLLEFVMAVEDAYGIELDDEAVSLCANIGDLVALVAAARDGR